MSTQFWRFQKDKNPRKRYPHIHNIYPQKRGWFN